MALQSLALDRLGALPPEFEMSYNRTVDRALVHRSALSEVFLTDYRRQDHSRFFVAAQLPPTHLYYTDHPDRPRVVDPVLLLECGRQAETYAAHAHFDVPLGYNFVLQSWSMSFEPLSAPAPGQPPLELLIEVETSRERRLRGVLRGVTYDMTMYAAGVKVCSLRMAVGYLPGEVYKSLRQGRQSGPPAFSDRMPVERGQVADPHGVGRTQSENVVISPLEALDEFTDGAWLELPYGNPSMFDHRQDHVPAMVMMEAARQICLHMIPSAPGFEWPIATIVGLSATFFQYAELDIPTRVLARSTDSVALGQGGPGTATVGITFEQGDSLAAEAQITLGVGLATT